MANKHTHKKMLTSLTMKEMQIKTTLRFHLTPARMACSKDTNTNVGKAVGKKDPLYTAGENAN
jgi:hypothetical protein